LVQQSLARLEQPIECELQKRQQVWSVGILEQAPVQLFARHRIDFVD
jgi:hypothetical protein